LFLAKESLGSIKQINRFNERLKTLPKLSGSTPNEVRNQVVRSSQYSNVERKALAGKLLKKAVKRMKQQSRRVTLYAAVTHAYRGVIDKFLNFQWSDELNAKIPSNHKIGSQIRPIDVGFTLKECEVERRTYAIVRNTSVIHNVKTEKDRRPIWHKFLKLNKKDFTVPPSRLNPRCSRNGYAWLTGLVYFNVRDFYVEGLENYIMPALGEFYCFVKTPSREILRKLLSKVISGNVRYFNIFGNYLTACKTQDRLLSYISLNADINYIISGNICRDKTKCSRKDIFLKV
jgi:hypothetical protein